MTFEAISETIASPEMTDTLAAILLRFTHKFGRGTTEAERQVIARTIVLNLMAGPFTEAAVQARAAQGYATSDTDRKDIQATVAKWLEQLTA